jgi:hypothetical protein
MFEVALKRAGFAVSCSRTASWEIPTRFLICLFFVWHRKVFQNLQRSFFICKKFMEGFASWAIALSYFLWKFGLLMALDKCHAFCS